MRGEPSTNIGLRGVEGTPRRLLLPRQFRYHMRTFSFTPARGVRSGLLLCFRASSNRVGGCT